MTLRRRLTVLVALAVVVPITAAGVFVVNLLGGEVEARSYDRLAQVTTSTQAGFEKARGDIERRVEARAADPRLVQGLDEAEQSAADQFLRQVLNDDDLDVVVITDEAGLVVASARRAPDFAGGIATPTDISVAKGETRRSFLATAILSGGRTLTGGQWLDANRLRQYDRSDESVLTIVNNGRVVSSTGLVRRPPRALAEGQFRAELAGRDAFVIATAIPGADALLLASSPAPQSRQANLIVVLGALLIIMVLLIALVGYVVSGLVTGPVEDLVDAAAAVSRGDLEQRVNVQGDVELATLGRAFNEMTENLRTYVRELEQSRTEFRQAIAHLGDVLVSTHDLPGIIEVVLEACALTLRAECAVFYERVAMPARIRATAAHGGDVPSIELNGVGVAGSAGRLLAPVRRPGPEPLAEGEPDVDAAAAVPVISDGRLFGVLAIYGRRGGGEFTAEDVDTLLTLARQAEVAIGNVMLYDETQRQARTDGMTGLWNRREFELRARESVRDAHRFHDPFGVIIVDVDDFKHVNDRYDHSTGDAALIWVASRLSEAVREVDMVARWGGEEFIVLLPRSGIDEAGAVAERVRQAVSREPMRDGDKVIPLTVSVGYAGHPHDGDTAEELFKAADAALLRAKRMGKDRVERARAGEIVS